MSMPLAWIGALAVPVWGRARPMISNASASTVRPVSHAPRRLRVGARYGADQLGVGIFHGGDGAAPAAPQGDERQQGEQPQPLG